VIAIVGVLLHALAIVRHHAVMMTDGLLAAPSTAAGLRIDSASAFAKLPLCRGNPGDAGESGEGPAQPQRGAPCPVCTGSVGPFALATSACVVAVLPRAGPPRLPDRPDHPLQAEHYAHPRARAPPAYA
jgi:hypothetical protein